MIYDVSLPEYGVMQAWRKAARLAISHRIPPQHIEWSGKQGLFARTELPQTSGIVQITVPQAFITLADAVIWHSDPERFALLYRALWQLAEGDITPLLHASPFGHKLNSMAKSVKRDIHKTHAFVRFRELPTQRNRRRFAAWFEPQHNTLEPSSHFFIERFSDMDWIIATPRLNARFVDGKLRFEPATSKPDLPDDTSEELWATYFSNIFNPARIKIAAMRSEMPKKYWKNLPETRLIPDMLKHTEMRIEQMREAGATTPNPSAALISSRYRAGLPRIMDMPSNLEEARLAANHCRRCHLCEQATQTVWGEGAVHADIMIVGEQPGDHEDLAGRPFVGPAGHILRTAIKQSGLDIKRMWITNAVKHFKYSIRNNRRLHENPNTGEIKSCRFWLDLELTYIQPRITLALGASAAFALTDNKQPLAERRGKIEAGIHGGPVLISWHPSYILRLQAPSEQEAVKRDLIQDLKHAHMLALKNSA